MLEKWEAMFKDSFQKWKETKEKLEIINEKLRNQAKVANLKQLNEIVKKNIEVRLTMNLK